MTFRAHLLRLRKERRLTQGVLAEKAGLSKRTIVDYEGGKAEPELASLIGLADALEVPLDQLVGRKTPPARVVVNGVVYVPEVDAPPNGPPSDPEEEVDDGPVSGGLHALHAAEQAARAQRRGSSRRDQSQGEEPQP